MVIGSDFEAEARNFALLESLYIFVYYAQWEISAFSSHEKEWIFFNRIFSLYGMGKYLMV